MTQIGLTVLDRRLKVLVISKFWYIRGGLERVMFDEIRGLESLGHVVGHFSTQHPENEASEFAQWFAPYIELGTGAQLSLTQKASAVARMFHNRTSARRVRRLLESFQPDIMHVHGIHRQLSPSVLFEARRVGVPVVQTVHDYHHACPADVMLRGGVRPCIPRACGKFWYGPAVENACVHGNRTASALSAFETGFQRVRRAYERCVAGFVYPSLFMENVMLDAGWTVRGFVVPNGVESCSTVRMGNEAEDYFLYAGRLSVEKGVGAFLEAASEAGVRAVIAGDGPLSTELRERFPAVQFVGHVDSAGVRELLSRCRAAVVPSESLENAPMAVLEAMAVGVPVVASRLGGIPELFENGIHGWLVRAGDREGLRRVLLEACSNPTRTAGMGQAAWERARTVYSHEAHMESLLAVYGQVLG